jgi:hypothetical protein
MDEVLDAAIVNAETRSARADVVFRVDIPLHECATCTPEEVAVILETTAKAVRNVSAIVDYHLVEESKIDLTYLSYGALNRSINVVLQVGQNPVIGERATSYLRLVGNGATTIILVSEGYLKDGITPEAVQASTVRKAEDLAHVLHTLGISCIIEQRFYEEKDNVNSSNPDPSGLRRKDSALHRST